MSKISLDPPKKHLTCGSASTFKQFPPSVPVRGRISPQVSIFLIAHLRIPKIVDTHPSLHLLRGSRFFLYHSLICGKGVCGQLARTARAEIDADVGRSTPRGGYRGHSRDNRERIWTPTKEANDGGCPQFLMCVCSEKGVPDCWSNLEVISFTFPGSLRVGNSRLICEPREELDARRPYAHNAHSP